MEKDNTKGDGAVKDGATPPIIPENKPEETTPEVIDYASLNVIANERIFELETELEALKKSIAESGAPPVIEGTIKIDKKTYRFKDGHKQIRLRGPRGNDLVSTEGLMALANGKKVSAEILKENPVLVKMEKERATEILENLVEVGYGYLQLVEPKK